MKINRRDRIDVLEDSDPDSKITYCRFCMVNFHLKHPLGPRKDYYERDADLWLQCYECWRIYPIYEAKYEGKLHGLIEAEQTHNPFEKIQSDVVGFDNRDYRPSEKERLRKKIRDEHDPDVRELLRQGYTIEDDYKWNYPEDE